MSRERAQNHCRADDEDRLHRLVEHARPSEYNARKAGENLNANLGNRPKPSLSPPQESVTELLVAWNRGDDSALASLIPVVHRELYRLARRYMRQERRDHTLQPTALVNEAYLRLVKARHVAWRDRAHFFGIAARLMRQVLVDHVRRQNFSKRGGQNAHLPLDEAMLVAEG